ncbi:DUF2057 family protein [Scandinavium goeteborgense]|uniref:DUF2057 domain-containing protein n=1 Tax=Scandinavium goeteborgense TaxID=1851514 RepID=A0A4R6DNW7_SCAGO|nr:DUF2057 family protein [Scandinavium goeteborgense]TDN46069.1 hypothetical protein EC847_1482 [Scandinavium goeteborgense]
MKKILLVSLLFGVSQAIASPTLSVGDNLTVLAAKSADMSIFSDSIALQDGEQKIVVKYDSPENPSSTNQSNGRITSIPYLLTFKASGDETITLTTREAADISDVRSLAKDPEFTLTVNGKAVSFTRSPLIRTSRFGSLSTSWDSVVNGDGKSSPAAAAIITAPGVVEATSIQAGSETMKTMQKLYLQSDAKQRKTFLKWAMDVE